MNRKSFVRVALLLMAVSVVPMSAQSVQAEDGPMEPVLECTADAGLDEIELASNSVEAADCIPRTKCCKVCTKSTACGNTCANTAHQCRKPRGCACNAKEVCR